jgi:ribonuclease HII
VAGADEAGRGCLAGPLVAAAVLLDLDSIGVAEVRALGALNDSKQHDHAAREALLPIVMQTAQRVVVVSRSSRGIDERGLHKTNLAALRESLIRVARPGCICLIDGFEVPAFEYQQRAVIGGDGLSAAIAAASIVAKVTRDRLMARAGETMPEWGFEEHFGYATPAHREAIIANGVSPIHRLSFKSSAYEQIAL